MEEEQNPIIKLLAEIDLKAKFTSVMKHLLTTNADMQFLEGEEKEDFEIDVLACFQSHFEGYERRIVDIYNECYTADEITELIKFYKTPLGKKTLNNIDIITIKTQEASNDWIKNDGVLDEINVIVEKYIEKIKTTQS